MFIILFILFIGIPLIKEEMENQNYREQCRRRGDKTYWSTDGLRYTDTNQKVHKQEEWKMFLISLIIFIGICIYHASEKELPAEYHRNWQLERDDLEKVYQGKMTQKEFVKNMNNGKYRQYEKIEIVVQKKQVMQKLLFVL